MNHFINEWKVYNISQGESAARVLSISKAIELVVEISKKEMGETIYFEHSDRGMICCTAGKGMSTLSFTPKYEAHTQSLAGIGNARSINGSEKLYHVDGIGSVSSIPPMYLLPILDVVRGLLHIFETHDFPSFLEWTTPVGE